MVSIKLKLSTSSQHGKKAGIVYQINQGRTLRHINTKYSILPEEWDSETNSIRTDIPGKEEEYNDIKEELELGIQVFKEVEFILNKQKKPYTIDDFIDFYMEKGHRLTFFGYMQEEIENWKAKNKLRTAETYTTTLYSTKRFFHDKNILLKEIDSPMIQKYEQFLLNTGITRNSTSFYMRILRAAYNRAVKEGIIEDLTPFKKVYTGVDETVKIVISEERLKQIKNLDLSISQDLSWARDMFMFSFYTRGMSFIDIMFLKKNDFIQDMLLYRRHKNKQQLAIKWEPCMQDIVDRYKSEPDSPYLLNGIDPKFDERKQYKTLLYKTNQSLKIISELIGLDFQLSMNVARHTWANLAHEKGVSATVIGEGLGNDHEDFIRLYLASMKNPEVDRVSKMLIDDI